MTGPLRIVQYITPSQIGGAEVHVTALADRLRARGHEVAVVCPRGRPLVAELVARGLRVRTPRTIGKLDPVTLARLVGWLGRDRAQVIHTHLSTASLLGSLAARIRGIPAVATVHGLNTRTCFNWAHAIIAVSNAVKQHLVAQGMAADLFVLPSIQEGLSLSALEAMALGKPVVACRVGGTPEVVVDGETGVLVSPGRPEELAGALERLLEGPDRARAMGAAGRRRVREAFDFEQMVSKIEEVYRRVISEHAAA